MELTAKQQTIEFIRNSNNIVLFTHINPDGDALGGLNALHIALEKLGKRVDSICANPLPNYLSFLPNRARIKNDFKESREFIISLDASRAKGTYQLGYKIDDLEKKLNIFITPESGNFESDDVSFRSGGFQRELAIVLDTPNVSRLGSVYKNNSDFFLEIPIINIDHHFDNDHFGRVNWVDLTATSTCEILVSMLESLGRDQSLIDKEVATSLLTGIITDTGSFQNSNTTPKSLTVAAQLVAVGADREKIIKSIYQTHSISTLKLWGRILSNINVESQEKFAWATVTSNDLILTGAKEEESSGIIDQFLKTIPDVDFVLLISERSGDNDQEKIVHASLRSAKDDVNVSEVAKVFGGGGHSLAAGFDMRSHSFEDSKNEIVAKIKKIQSNKYANAEN